MHTILKNKIIFIPETAYNFTHTHYDYQFIDSFNMRINLITGARGIGKTFGAKKKIIKDFIYNENKFIWLRDTESALDNLRQQNGLPFFDDIQNKVFTQNFEATIMDESILINDKLAGNLMALSTMHSKKGNSFDTFKTIVFDEFMAESDQVQRGNRTRQFLNAIQTLGRLRNDFKVYMLANALDRGNELLRIFNFKIHDYGFYINREKSAVLHYASNSHEFDRLNDLSIAGNLVKGTVYEDTISHNIFSDNDIEYFDKKPPTAKLLSILGDEDTSIRVFIHNDILLVATDINPFAYPDRRFVTKIKNVTRVYKLISPQLYDIITKLWSAGKIKYENAFCKNIFEKIMLKK